MIVKDDLADREIFKKKRQKKKKTKKKTETKKIQSYRLLFYDTKLLVAKKFDGSETFFIERV